MPTYERPATKNDLKAVHQYKGEMLRQYIQRFSQMRNKIPKISNEEVISAFSTSVSDIKMREKLSVNDELTSCTTCRRRFPQSRSPRTPNVTRLLSSRWSLSISSAAGTAPTAIKVDVAATASSTKRTPTIPTIVGLSKSFMKKMASPSAVGVAVATARVDPGAIAATTTGTKVAAVMVYLVQIPSHCRCLLQRMIIVKRTRGAIKSREVLPLAS
jgi:phage-related minor tail protein